MANGTRSSHKVKIVAEKSSPRIKSIHEKESKRYDDLATTSGLRRSTREVSLKQPASSTLPSTTRKSERLDKQFPTTPVKKKGSVSGKNLSSSSPKCSQKKNNSNSSISPASKKTDKDSGFSSMKNDTEKKGSFLASGTYMSDGRRKYSAHFVRMKKNRMDARVYRSLLFSPQDNATSSGDSPGSKKTDKLPKNSKISDGYHSDEYYSGGSESDKIQEKDCEEEHQEGFKEVYGGESCQKSGEGSQSSGYSSEKSERFTEKSVESEGGSDLQVLEDGTTDPLPSCNEFVAEDQGTNDTEAVQYDSLGTGAVEPYSFMRSASRTLHSVRVPGLANSAKRSRDDADINCDDDDATDSKSNKLDSTSIWSSCGSEKSTSEVSSEHHKKRRIQNSPKEGEFLCCAVEQDKVLSKPASPAGREERDGSGNCVSSENCMDHVEHELDSSNINVYSTNSNCCLCNGDGELLQCDGKGCGRSFHNSCLDPSFKKVVDGYWCCIWCVNKKVEFGVHSVSEVESVWDVKDVDFAVRDGSGKEKIYFVKYKGLSHVHNNWIRESQLLRETAVPAKIHKKNQWKHEWAVPQRLLKRRLVTPPKLLGRNECTQNGYNEDCHHEWLVKWRGLGYDSATWELENTLFLNLPDVHRLICEYNRRCEMSKRLHDRSTINKARENAIKLSSLPGDVSGKVESNYLLEINKLREHWYNSKNAAVFDEQDRIVRIVVFVLSLQNDVARPSLIITPLSSLSLWEAEFSRLAPSVNAVAYSGGKAARYTIRKLEFYGDTGVVIFHVLLATPESFIEDIEDLDCIGWEVVIVDECQRIKLSMYSDKLNQLVTDFRLLIFSGYGKESAIKYQNYLSFLDESNPREASDAGKSDCGQITLLKEKLLNYLAYDYKTDSLKAVEYWVPVKFSNVQLEQYCSTLYSNSIALRSCLKTEVVDAFRDILVSLYKCCDHPYIVDIPLQKSLIGEIPDIDGLNIAIMASGKLYFLDSILPVIKVMGLRALILYQSISGSVRNAIGDFLDDYMRQRFGKDSYERVDGGGFIPSRKQNALNMFNNKECGRFVFILETRACLPSIKLTSVDIVIIFNSDWNPANDIKAFHRITIESNTKPIKIFRLYTPCTVEEKVLILSKETPLDCNFGNISRSVIHVLLSWGAPSLFRMLDTFHGENKPLSSRTIFSENEFLGVTVREFTNILSQRGDKSNVNQSSYILNVGGSEDRRYIKNIRLLGESEDQSGETQPHVFWAKLLEERFPLWKFYSMTLNRNRRSAQYAGEMPANTELETPMAVKKRRKVDKGKSTSTEKEGNMGDINGECQSNLNPTLFENKTHGEMHNTPVSTTDTRHVHEISPTNVGGSDNARNAQKQLHLLLKPKISELCESLNFSDAVKVMAEKFLDYIMNNHAVKREEEGILQALQISVCWSAATLLKQKYDHNETLSSVQRDLGFCCLQEIAESVYSKLRPLRRSFLQQFDSNLQTETPHAVGGVLRNRSAVEDIPRNESTVEDIPGNRSTVEDIPGNRSAEVVHSTVSISTEVVAKKKESTSSHLCVEAEASKQELAETNKLSEIIAEVKQNYLKQMEVLQKKRDDEIEQHRKDGENEKSQLWNQYRVELSFIHSLYSHVPTRLSKLNILEVEFAAKMKEHKALIEVENKELEAKHHAAVSDLEEKEAQELQELSSKSALESGSGEEDTTQHADDRAPLCEGSRMDSGEKADSQLIDRDNSHVVLGSLFQKGSNYTHQNHTILENSTAERLTVTLIDPIPASQVSEHTSTSLQHDVVAGLDQFVPSSRPCCDAPANDPSPPRPSEQPPSLQLPCNFTTREPVNEDQTHLTPLQPQVENRPTASVDDPSQWFSVLSSSEPRIGTDMEKDNEVGGSSVLEIPPADGMIPSNFIPPSVDVIRPPLPTDVGSIGMLNSVQMPQSSPQTDRPCEIDYNLPIEAEGRQGSEGSASLQHFRVQFEEGDQGEAANEFIQHPTSCLGINPQLESSAGGTGINHSDARPHSVSVSLGSFSFPSVPRPSYPSCQDPLQSELERVGRDMEQLVKTHEDMKLVLKSDCEKEIEDMVSQIRRKYELTLQGMDETYMNKRKEMDLIYNKVLMNKILADALRYKSMDMKASGLPKIHQGHTAVQTHPQQHRPPLFIPTPPAAPAAHPHRLHHAPPPATAPLRPPHISPVTLSSAFHSNEVRGPAPHLHQFRQPSSHSVPGFPPLHGHHHPAPAPHPHPPVSLHPPPQTRPHRPDLLGELRQKEADLRQAMLGTGSLLPDLGCGFDTWDGHDVAATGGGSSRAHTLPEAEPVVVCLSDDD